MNKKVEQLASIQHDIWSHWMKYLFDVSHEMDDLRVAIDMDKVERWKRQMNTPYKELTDKEKQSDRDQVMKFIHLVGGGKSDSVLSPIIESYFAFAEYLKDYDFVDNGSEGNEYLHAEGRFNEKEIYERWRNSL